MPAPGDNSAHFAPFPATQHSAVAGLGSGDAATRERAWNAIVGGYWKPVYCYVRAKWRAGGVVRPLQRRIPEVSCPGSASASSPATKGT